MSPSLSVLNIKQVLLYKGKSPQHLVYLLQSIEPFCKPLLIKNLCVNLKISPTFITSFLSWWSKNELSEANLLYMQAKQFSIGSHNEKFLLANYQ